MAGKFTPGLAFLGYVSASEIRVFYVEQDFVLACLPACDLFMFWLWANGNVRARAFRRPRSSLLLTTALARYLVVGRTRPSFLFLPPPPSAPGNSKGHGPARPNDRRGDTEMGFIVKYCHCHSF